jgi:hypothetical protein
VEDPAWVPDRLIATAMMPIAMSMSATTVVSVVRCDAKARRTPATRLLGDEVIVDFILLMESAGRCLPNFATPAPNSRPVNKSARARLCRVNGSSDNPRLRDSGAHH